MHSVFEAGAGRASEFVSWRLTYFRERTQLSFDPIEVATERIKLLHGSPPPARCPETARLITGRFMSDVVTIGGAECVRSVLRSGVMGTSRIDDVGVGVLVAGLGIRELLVPVIEVDAVEVTGPFSDREARSAVVRKDPAAVGPVDLQAGRDLGDGGSGDCRAELLDTEVHTAPIVSLRHGVKRAPFRLLSVPKKTGQLKDPSLLAAVGSRFQRERKDKKITHDWLAAKVGMNRQSIGRFEAGERGMDASALVALLLAAAEKGVDVAFVLTGSRDPATDAIRSALLDPVILSGLREAGLLALAKGRRASGDENK